MTAAPRVLVAGVGNVLRCDDGFGPAVVAALEEQPLPEGVRTVEVGIGGMGMIHELMDGYDALVVIDAVDRDAEPGTLHVLEPEVPDRDEIGPSKRGQVADLHQLVPGRMLVLARALDILPSYVRIVGCQPLETDELTTELSPPVSEAVPRAVSAVREMIESLSRDREEAAGV